MNKDNGGPAFPNDGAHGWTTPSVGMTIRDYFAAKAMQGMLASSENYPTPELVKYAYEVAGAMLDARSKAAAPPPIKKRWQYLYKAIACRARDSMADNCICWHDEGTGQFSSLKHDESGSPLQWREVPNE